MIPRVSKSRVENVRYPGSLLWNQLSVWVSPKPLKLGLKPCSLIKLIVRAGSGDNEPYSSLLFKCLNATTVCH